MPPSFLKKLRALRASSEAGGKKIFAPWRLSERYFLKNFSKIPEPERIN